MSPVLGVWGEQDSNTQSILEFLKKNNDEITVCALIWSNYIGTPKEFRSLRCTIWPDSQFYNNTFVLDRLVISLWLLQTTDLTCPGLGLPSPSARALLVRNFLSQGAQLDLDRIGKRILDPGSSATRVWLKFTFDALGHHALHCRGNGLVTLDPCWELSKDLMVYVIKQAGPLASTSTSLHEFLFDISVQRPYHGSILLGINSYKDLRRAMRGYELLLREQLKVMSELGVDLTAFGEYSSSRSKKEEPIAFWSDADTNRAFQARVRPTRLESNRPLRSDSRPILSRSYGPHPRDWRIWFEEPTDEYGGDFWQLVDPAPMSIPGAWVDEE